MDHPVIDLCARIMVVADRDHENGCPSTPCWACYTYVWLRQFLRNAEVIPRLPGPYSVDLPRGAR